MRFEVINYPYPHFTVPGSEEEKAAYQGRHHRYLGRLEGCRCYPYVDYERDVFVIDSRNQKGWKDGLWEREGEKAKKAPRHLRVIKRLQFSKWKPGIGSVVRGLGGLDSVIIRLRGEAERDVFNRRFGGDGMGSDDFRGTRSWSFVDEDEDGVEAW
jgi:hypothetical protein